MTRLALKFLLACGTARLSGATEGEEALSAAMEAGREVEALKQLAASQMEATTGQDELVSILSIAYSRPSESLTRHMQIKLRDLGAVGPAEMTEQQSMPPFPKEVEHLELQTFDKAIAAATEGLQYIPGVGIGFETVVRTKMTGSIPFRQTVRRVCHDAGVEEHEQFHCRMAVAEVMACNLLPVVIKRPYLPCPGQKLWHQVQGMLPVHVRSNLATALPAAAALSAQGAKTELAGSEEASESSETFLNLKAVDASKPGIHVLHELETPQPDEEWAKADTSARSLLRIFTDGAADQDESEDEKENGREIWPQRFDGLFR